METVLAINLIFGPVCLLGFAVLSAAKDIALEGRLKAANPHDYLLLVFVFTAIVYHAACKLNKRNAKLLTPIQNREFLLLNLGTAGNWIGLFLSLKYLNAPAVAALYSGIIPMATLIVNRFLRPGSAVIPADYVATILLLCCSVAWAFYNALSFQSAQAGIGVIYVVFSSFTIAATTVISKRLADAGTRAASIMAHRFYVLIGVALFMSSPFPELITLIQRDIEILIFIAVGGTVASLWLLQKGIEKCEPVVTEVIIATSPIVSLLLYSLTIGGTSIDSSTFLLSILVSSVALAHTLVQYRSVRSQ